MTSNSQRQIEAPPQPTLAEVIPLHPEDEADIAVGGLRTWIAHKYEHFSTWLNSIPETGAGSLPVTREQLKAIDQLNLKRNR